MPTNDSIKCSFQGEPTRQVKSVGVDGNNAGNEASGFSDVNVIDKTSLEAGQVWNGVTQHYNEAGHKTTVTSNFTAVEEGPKGGQVTHGSIGVNIYSVEN